MYACIHDLCYTNGENIVRFQVHNDAVKGKCAIGEDYGSICTCITGSISSQSLQPFPNAIGLQDYSWPNKICRKVSFKCSIA